MATQIIPPGYSKITFTWTLTGTTRFYQSSIEVQNLLLDGNPSGLLSFVRTAFTGVSGPFVGGNMYNGYVLAETKITMVTLGGVLLTSSITAPITGGKVAGSPAPINTSVIVRKTVLQAGKKYRGRMLIPPMFFAESDIDAAGNISTVSTYQAFWNNVYTAINPSQTIVLLHSDPAIAPTPVTALTVNSKIGTIGKRMRG